VEHRELRACDFGAPTIRKRLFLVARRDGLPITWPQPTHAQPDDSGKVAKDSSPGALLQSASTGALPRRPSSSASAAGGCHLPAHCQGHRPLCGEDCQAFHRGRARHS
jgi:site-specific DNA-cytosine methylase